MERGNVESQTEAHAMHCDNVSEDRGTRSCKRIHFNARNFRPRQREKKRIPLGEKDNTRLRGNKIMYIRKFMNIFMQSVRKKEEKKKNLKVKIKNEKLLYLSLILPT